jgi:hypothetical protein
MAEGTIIGTLEITEPRKYRQSYECAAWYEDAILDPGIFDLTLSFSPELWPDAVYWGQMGTVTGDCFDSLWCGNLIKAHRNERVGERKKYSDWMRAYQFCTQKIGTLNLLPEWQWLLLDSGLWSPHVSRLQSLRTMRQVGMKIVSVKLGEGTNFVVSVDDGKGGWEIPFSIEDHNLKFGGNVLFDTRESSQAWSKMYKFCADHGVLK